MSSHHACQPDPVVITNTPAPDTSYFTPAQVPPAGTASDPQPDGTHPPSLFKPFRIRDVQFQNRIFLSPLCQYSAQDGHMTPWHMAHLGGIASRGPGLVIMEATAVRAEGRITPEDVGLWKDSQIEPIAKVIEFIHSQGQKVAAQLAHAGRKASTVAPWLSHSDIALKEANGWPDNVFAPSAIAYNDKHCTPKAMTKSDIEDVVNSYVDAAKRAIRAGVDVIEIHGAHGYLIHEFLSPYSNKRTDDYGGSFENRTRLVIEIAEALRATMPETMPLFIRVSADDWLSHTGSESWTIEQTCQLATILAERGVDFFDISSAGLHPDQKIEGKPGYQAHFAKAVKETVGDKAVVSAVGSITTGKQAQKLLDDKWADVIMAGRTFQKNPGLVWAWAEELGTEIMQANQIRWGFGGRAVKKITATKN